MEGWSFTSDVDEELFTELVDVEANPLRELLMVNMNQPQKTRTRQLAVMLTMHTKDRARQMITKLSDPCNRYEIWRRFLEEWEPSSAKSLQSHADDNPAIHLRKRPWIGSGRVGATRETKRIAERRVTGPEEVLPIMHMFAHTQKWCWIHQA